MTARLCFGSHNTLELDFAPERMIACCGSPQSPSLGDVEQAANVALAAPLGFPPLAQAVVPGDRVVLALDHDVPGSREIVAALFDCLVGRGLQPADITLLTVAPHRAATELRGFLPAKYRDAAAVEVHYPDARDRLSYLAAGTAKESIYLNRLLCDADVVVPIGCLRCEPAVDYHGIYGGLFPTFSGRAAQDKLFAQADTHAARNEARCRDAIQEVGWLLGVQFTVQIVPGPAGEVLHVLAGNPADVFREGQAACQRAWSFVVPRAAKLVIAAIDGGEDEQTWDNVARAVTAAARLVVDDGAIVLCTALSLPPGPTVQRACAASDTRAALRSLRKKRLDDSLPAVALAEALARVRVYLMSQLEDAVVEEMNIAPVADTAEIARLVERHDTCILLSNAQYTVAALAGD